MLVSICYGLIILYFIISIICFVKVIRSKTRLNTVMNIIGIILSTIIPVGYILYTWSFYLDVGLELLIFYIFIGVSGLLSLISIIIGLIKRKRNVTGLFDKKKFRSGLIIFVVPALLVLGLTLLDIEKINSSNLIIVFRYDNGIVSSEYNTYGVTEKKINSIEIGNIYIEKFIKTPVKELKGTTYLLTYNYDTNKYKIKSYEDKKLEKIDTNIVSEIITDSTTKRNNGTKITDIQLTLFEGSDYYLVEQTKKDSFTYNVHLYKNNKYIDRITGSIGSIDKIILKK